MPGSRRALAAALATLLAASPALAQPKSSSNKPPQEVAGDLVKQAITKSQAGDHLGAIDLYLNAYSLIPQHALLSNVGNEYQQAGKLIEALKYFCMYLEKDPTGTSATYAIAKAKAIRTELGRAEVDDDDVCAPEPPPQRPPPPPPSSSSERKRGNAGAGFRYAGYTAGALGLAGVVAGSYFGVKAFQRSNEITNHIIENEWGSDIRAREAEGQKWEDRQIQLTIAGGALVATGLVLYLLGRSRGEAAAATALSVIPTATPDGIGVTIGRGF